MTKCLLYLTLALLCHSNIIAIPWHKTISPSLFPLDTYLAKHNQKNLRVINTFSTAHFTKIAVLKNDRSEKFIVKQDTNGTLEASLKCALRDIVASLIAHSAGVQANHITFIPAGTPFLGKSITKLPATLHNFVPGTVVRALPKKSPWHNASIHQYMKDNVPEKQWGLTRSVIKNMSQHKDLCKITAVDTFTANTDRSLNNYLYDEETDSFYAIDFECTFRKNLAHYGCKTLEHMLKNSREKITSQEYAGLKIYRDTLARLIKLYPPQIIDDYFFAIAQQGDTKTKDQYAIVAHYKNKYGPAMIENYTACKQIVTLIDRLLAHRY